MKVRDALNLATSFAYSRVVKPGGAWTRRGIGWMGWETGIGLLGAMLVLFVAFLEKATDTGRKGTFNTRIFENLEAKLIDLRFLAREKTVTKPPEIIVLTIDDRSCEDASKGGFGKYPWRRSIMAKGLAHLRDMEPGVVALDILYLESEFVEERKMIGGLKTAVEEALATLAPGASGAEEALARLKQALPPPSAPGADHLRTQLAAALDQIGKSTARPRESLQALTTHLDALLTEFNGDVAMAEAMGPHEVMVDGKPAEKGMFPILAYAMVEEEDFKRGDQGRSVTDDFRTLLASYTYPVNLRQDVESCAVDLPIGYGLYYPLSAYTDVCGALAHVNIVLDPDGGLRHEALGWRYLLHPMENATPEERLKNMDVLPPLSIQAFSQWQLMTRNEDKYQKNVKINVTAKGRPYAEIGDIVVPLDHHGRFPINFIGATDTFHTISFRDVFYSDSTPVAEGAQPTEAQRQFLELKSLVKGKIIFVGSTAVGAFDHYVTPFTALYPGVFRHATVAENLIHRRFLREVEFFDEDALPWYLFSILLVAGIMGMLATHTRPYVPAILGAGVIAAYIWVCFWQFAHNGLALNIIIPFTSLSLSFAGILTWRVLHEERSKRVIKGMFGNYLSPEVVNELTKNPNALKLGGELREATIFFSDVKGFTSLSEKMPVDQLVTMLNEYFGEMGDAILSKSGRIDKYIGDGIMAEFGVPVPNKDHAGLACRSAIDQIVRLKRLNESFSKRGWPEMEIRIGLHTGNVKAGNFGSAKALSYTVIGDDVNLASRLEGANKGFGTNIMASEPTWEKAKEAVEGRELDLIRVVGKNEPVRVFEIMGLKGQLSPERQSVQKHYNAALKSFRERNWDSALDGFVAALEIDPDDGPSQAYIDRCREYMANPPPADWDGVFTLEHK